MTVFCPDCGNVLEEQENCAVCPWPQDPLVNLILIESDNDGPE